jgi:hypothetical protein
VTSDDGCKLTLGSQILLDSLDEEVLRQEVSFELQADSCTPLEFLYVEFTGSARAVLEWQYLLPGSVWSTKTTIPARYLQPSKCTAPPPSPPDLSCAGLRAQYFDLNTNLKLTERIEPELNLRLADGQISDAIAPKRDQFSYAPILVPPKIHSLTFLWRFPVFCGLDA